MPFWTYMLRCADGHYYTGHTDDLERRIAEHEAGAFASCWTYKRRPVELVWSEAFQTRHEALDAERRVGGWSKAKKEALIRGDWWSVMHFARPPGKRAGSPPEPRFSTGLETNGVGGTLRRNLPIDSDGSPTPFASSNVEKRSPEPVTPTPFASSPVEKRSPELGAQATLEPRP